MNTSTSATAPSVGLIRPSKGARWTGRVMTALIVLFLVMDGVMKLVKPDVVVKGTLELGYPESSIFGLGVVLLASVVLHLIPRTAVLGAILLTGYLGGAVATHVRVGNPLFSHVLFPIYFGALLWAGLFLRDPSRRAMFTGRSTEASS
jgi:hypothetical protein